MVRVTEDREERFFYDVGPNELATLIDEFGEASVAIMEWGDCGPNAVGTRSDDRARILKLLNNENI